MDVPRRKIHSKHQPGVKHLPGVKQLRRLGRNDLARLELQDETKYPEERSVGSPEVLPPYALRGGDPTPDEGRQGGSHKRISPFHSRGDAGSTVIQVEVMDC